MIAVDRSQRAQFAIGIDVGGTKCAAGLVLFPEGGVLARRLQPTRPERGGDAVLADVIDMACSLQREAAELGVEPTAIGLGVAELVNAAGEVLSDATILWRGREVGKTLQAVTRMPVQLDADVRAAARGEAHLGAGRSFRLFLYVTVGTGISASLVIERMPYTGARGLTGTFASSRSLIPSDSGRLAAGPALEQFAAGPALAARFGASRPGFNGTAFDVVALAEAGDSLARETLASSGSALGAAIGQLVNVLDPEAVVIGGGLGMVGGVFRESLEHALREHIWSDLHRGLPLVSAELGNDAGFIGAAFGACRSEDD
jgi:glucokinase